MTVTSHQFHYLRAAFSSHLKTNVGNILVKVPALCINLKYGWGSNKFYITHSPITLANLSSINLVSIFRCSSPPDNPVYLRRVDPSALSFSLSSH